jgi:hypothetical protein
MLNLRYQFMMAGQFIYSGGKRNSTGNCLDSLEDSWRMSSSKLKKSKGYQIKVFNKCKSSDVRSVDD